MSWVKIPLETDGGTWTLHLVNNLEKMKRNITKGEKIYEEFAKCFGVKKLSMPRTDTLELFALLEQKGEHALLLREMMKEFISNIDDVEIIVRKGKLFRKTYIEELFYIA